MLAKRPENFASHLKLSLGAVDVTLETTKVWAQVMSTVVLTPTAFLSINVLNALL